VTIICMEDLIKTHVLPRLDQLEVENMLLRKHIWPYVQAQKEVNQLDDLQNKREFMSVLIDEEIKELLVLKNKINGGNGLLETEYQRVRSNYQYGKASPGKDQSCQVP